jgi:ParB-like chromosome segregation protein Spo0J
MESPARQPVSNVEWIPRDQLTPNDYNPNQQPSPEHRLLIISILRDGWTQPIVVFDDGIRLTIVDGEHRWRASGDPGVWKLTGGLVPIVRISGTLQERKAATIRHNRARGEHGVLPMAELIAGLLRDGMDADDICFELQMEPEEVERLADAAGMPTRVSRDGTHFSKEWIPKC